jgi:hypothetical protein
MSDFVLAKIDKARQLLAEAKTVQEAKQIADVAEAARVYAKRVEASIITVNHAAEIKIRAERLLGEMLAQTPKNTGAKGIGKSVLPLGKRTPKLDSVGISHKQSARSQKLASIPAPQFEETIVHHQRAGKELTTAAMLRAAAATAVEEDSDEVCWRRGLLYRAGSAAADAAFEDWSHFQVDLQLVNTAARAAQAWRKLADYLRKIHNEQKKNHPRAA